MECYAGSTALYTPAHRRRDSEDDDYRRPCVPKPKSAPKPRFASKKPLKPPKQTGKTHAVAKKDLPERQRLEEPEAERLKRFLIHTLSVDYQTELFARLTSVDKQHFTRVYSILRSFKYRASTQFTGLLRGTRSSILRKYLCEPCIALGVPVEAAATAIMRYLESTDWRGRYHGSVERTLRASGLGALATKHYVDRKILSPALIKTPPLLNSMCLMVDGLAKQYFDRIDGFEGWMSHVDHGRQWNEIRAVDYVANDRDRILEERYKAASSAFVNTAVVVEMASTDDSARREFARTTLSARGEQQV
ncbi:hypothetical protein K431DRAFT_310550 [Polychaeton citri CBS 116435]|uniref:Uncharacterized protein n=1 Tax=Polychaeton citri CBS 116435 TaxID=1314669 RepID=A0A9P4QCD6_9PEZI|nr:hypothetical protein K431DRAFT_310550 [Polychaeton citri CBS 116435]